MPSDVVKAFAKKTGKTVAAVEKLWDKAKEIAAKEGKPNDWEFITGILKRMLRIESGESGEGNTSPDYPLLLEVWGPEFTARLLTEAMPSSTKANLAMRWLEVEKQLRNIPSGTVSWPTMARSLRQMVYTMLNWLENDKQAENHRKYIGIV